MHLFANKQKINLIANDMAENLNQSARSPMFYTKLGVNDNIQGRLDLTLLHLAVLSAATPGQKIAQKVFDVVFAQIEQSLRQVGVGDLSVPRKMRDIMRASNGLTHVLSNALSAEGTDDLSQVILKNLYNDNEEQQDNAKAVANYIRSCYDALQTIDDAGDFRDAGHFPLTI